jgi:hypothetical protein
LELNFIKSSFNSYVKAPVTKFVDGLQVKKKVKQSRYRPGVAQRVPGS